MLLRFGVRHHGSILDGACPSDALLDVDGTLYGPTQSGTAGAIYGSVFSVAPRGVRNVVYAFPETPGADERYDGLSPYSDLINVGGVLYGNDRPRRARRATRLASQAPTATAFFRLSKLA